MRFKKLSISTPKVLVINPLCLIDFIWLTDVERTEGVLTNRAVAYIKQKKFKEAMRDCEHALSINPKFSKAHMRAYTCYVQLGEFSKAEAALDLAIGLGD